MSDRTEFAGLIRLEPGDSIAEDGYAFQAQNPLLIDRLLRLAVVSHKHDAHAALVPIPDPDEILPVVEVLPTGGTIPSDVTITVGYTLIDADGGETALASEEALVVTQSGLTTPENGPTGTWDTDSGALLAGNYSYAVTVTDGLGGETMLSPRADVTIEPGSASNEIVLTDLDTILAETGGTTWRMWKSVDGSDFVLIEEGATADFTDDGIDCTDASVRPPDFTGTTNATSLLKVTIPGTGQPVLATRFRIYGFVDGQLDQAALLGDYPVSDFDDEKTYLSLDFMDGVPPEVSTAHGGANKINALTDIINLEDAIGPGGGGALDLGDNFDWGTLAVTLRGEELFPETPGVLTGDLANYPTDYTGDTTEFTVSGSDVTAPATVDTLVHVQRDDSPYYYDQATGGITRLYFTILDEDWEKIGFFQNIEGPQAYIAINKLLSRFEVFTRPSDTDPWVLAASSAIAGADLPSGSGSMTLRTVGDEINVAYTVGGVVKPGWTVTLDGTSPGDAQTNWDSGTHERGIMAQASTADAVKFTDYSTADTEAIRTLTVEATDRWGTQVVAKVWDSKGTSDLGPVLADEGSDLTRRSKIDFVGGGVTVTDEGDHIQVSVAGGASAHVIKEDGTPLTARAGLNFVGNGVTATDDAGGNETEVNIPGNPVIKDEGTPLTARSGINFIGAGVTVTDDAGGDETEVNIPGNNLAGHVIGDEGTGLAQRDGLDFQGAGVTATDDAGGNKTVVTIPGGGSAHTIKEEGTPLTARAGLNFIGAGVTATDDAGGNETEVAIPGKHVVKDEGTPVTARSGLNFIGAGVTVTDDAGGDETEVTIPGPNLAGHVIEDESSGLTQRGTIDFQGAGVTAADSGGKTVVTIPGSGTGGHTIKEEGTPLTQRAGLNFIGAGVTATDDSGGNETEIAIPGVPSRGDVAVTTASLALDAEETGTIALPKGFRLLRLQTSRAARVRLYGTSAHRTADASRAIGTDPTGDHGVMLDFVTTGADLDWTMAPPVHGTNMDGTPADTMYYAITNKGATGTVTATFTVVRTEA